MYFPLSRIFAVLVLLAPGLLPAQEHLDIPVGEIEHVCELPSLPDGPAYRRPYVFRKGTPEKSVNFSITYLPQDSVYNGRTCLEWPDSAKSAFSYAAAIWSDVLQGTQTVNVNACYTALGPGILGSAGSTLRALGNVFGQDYVIFPQAVQENILGGNYAGPDINAYFNSDFAPNYYFDTDANPPPGKYDFVSVVIHELGHGLGFAGSGLYDDGTEPAECSGINGDGCVGLFTSINNTVDFHPYAYDMFVNRISDDSLLHDVRPHPGQAIGDALTGSGDAIIFNAGNSNEFSDATGIHQLYSPATFRRGSSYSHFNDPSEIMYYAISPSSAIHDVGNATIIMESMGWQAAAVALPVEWIAFTAEGNETAVELTWKTGAEKQNSHFEVEASRNEGRFTQIGRVPASGGSSGSYVFHDEEVVPGDNYYRLRQVDHDGRAQYSKAIHHRRGGEGTRSDISVFPNPTTSGTLNILYPGSRGDNLHVELLDGLGRRVGSEDFRMEGESNRLAVDVAALPAGIYGLLMIAGSERHYRTVVLR